MTQPTAFGRKLPRNDWEGDDFVPGSGGKYVTCTDTAAGRMVTWATNGRIDKDGQVYRNAVKPRDTNGITLEQAHDAVLIVARLNLLIPNWTLRKIKSHLRSGGGLVVQGWYSAIPRMYRYQKNANFPHALWLSHLSKTAGIRYWDALNPDTSGYGRWIPEAYVWDFLHSMDYSVAYVPLEHL